MSPRDMLLAMIAAALTTLALVLYATHADAGRRRALFHWIPESHPLGCTNDQLWRVEQGRLFQVPLPEGGSCVEAPDDSGLLYCCGPPVQGLDNCVFSTLVNEGEFHCNRVLDLEGRVIDTDREVP